MWIVIAFRHGEWKEVCGPKLASPRDYRTRSTAERRAMDYGQWDTLKEAHEHGVFVVESPKSRKELLQL